MPPGTTTGASTLTGARLAALILSRAEPPLGGVEEDAGDEVVEAGMLTFGDLIGDKRCGGCDTILDSGLAFFFCFLVGENLGTAASWEEREEEGPALVWAVLVFTGLGAVKVAPSTGSGAAREEAGVTAAAGGRGGGCFGWGWCWGGAGAVLRFLPGV